MIRAALARLSVVERAALAARWAFWARPKQLPPPTSWKTWGFLTGRGFGKTIAVSNHINGEVEAARATLICLLAQDEQSAVDIQVLGPSGLIATAPPWNRPNWQASDLQLVWPNGARAYVRTPEVPGKIRGLEYQLTWASELQSWPIAHRQEALDNVFLSTRLGYARVVWDATPKRRHPLLKQLLKAAEERPLLHRVVRGTTHENAANLGDGYVEELEIKYGGTARGKEELLGEMLEDSENALVKQEWIERSRRGAPTALARRVLSLDPAVTSRKGSDNTGIVDVGLGPDGQAYVLGDASGKVDVGKWAEIALDWYVQRDIDLILAETNKGGALIAQNLRAAAKERGLEVIVIDKDERPYKIPGKVFVKEVFARGSKEDRAEPVATAYEKRRVSHVRNVDLASLEDTLTTWEPSPSADSPGDLDALVHAIVELLDLSKNVVDPARAFAGIIQVSKEIQAPMAATSLTSIVASSLAGHSRPSRI
jgi:phage terminase large subunit-like protein